MTLQSIADGISHADEEGNFLFQPEVGMNPEITQVVARHFVGLPMMARQQRGTTARSTGQGEDHPFQADVEVNPETITSQVAARQEFARLPMGWQLQGMIAGSKEQNKQFDPGKYFCRIAGRFVFCILCVFFYVLVYLLFFFVFQ